MSLQRGGSSRDSESPGKLTNIDDVEIVPVGQVELGVLVRQAEDFLLGVAARDGGALLLQTEHCPHRQHAEPRPRQEQHFHCPNVLTVLSGSGSRQEVGRLRLPVECLHCRLGQPQGSRGRARR